ncbi:hypothetical protein [Bradyrhizobium tunisiense]|uniref:hypothetical protein n=1 Tax=Bradyrhizobium tunisiense TaxID=3278709 RepID=UPI0035DBF150
MQSDNAEHSQRRDDRQVRRSHADELLDEALRETFPASDPIAIDISEPPGDQANSAAPPNLIPPAGKVASTTPAARRLRLKLLKARA